jgi:hypothetical protein
MKFSRFENDIYIIDYSGIITFDEGLSNMTYIENEIRKVSSDNGYLKIVFDIRNTKWESRESHDKLSRIARGIFAGKPWN